MPALVGLVKHMWVCCGVCVCVCVCVCVYLYIVQYNRALYSCSITCSSDHWNIAVCTGHVRIGKYKVGHWCGCTMLGQVHSHLREMTLVCLLSSLPSSLAWSSLQTPSLPITAVLMHNRMLQRSSG